MLHEIPTLAQLLKTLQQVPYLASKNVYHVANYFLQGDVTRTEQFCAVLLSLHTKLKTCDICCWWYESGKDCLFCVSTKRDQSIVCVVESWQEVLTIERAQGYKGVYHVLGGVISPLEGVGPDDLSITKLVSRVTKNQISEVIFATSQTPEGEATASYIARLLRSYSVKISCVARGLPVGSAVSGMDPLTVYKALSERRPF